MADIIKFNKKEEKETILYVQCLECEDGPIALYCTSSTRGNGARCPKCETFFPIDDLSLEEDTE